MELKGQIDFIIASKTETDKSVLIMRLMENSGQKLEYNHWSYEDDSLEEHVKSYEVGKELNKLLNERALA